MPAIKDQQSLRAALDKCSGGERVYLDSPCADVVLGHRFPADKPVTITGRFVTADPGPDVNWNRALELRGSAGIVLDDCGFEGNVRSPFDRAGTGLYVTDCQDVTVRRSSLGRGRAAGYFERSQRLRIIDNDIDDVGIFGIQVAQVSDSEIARNFFRGPHFDSHDEGSSHADAIMLMANDWTEHGCVNLMIADNLIVGDPNSLWQGIFTQVLGNQPRHANIQIWRNRTAYTMWRGISLGEAIDSAIIDNIVLTLPPARTLPNPLPGGDVTAAWIVDNGARTMILGNKAKQFLRDDKAAASPGVRVIAPATTADLDAMIAGWMIEFRKSRAVPDPRIAERDALRISIPIDTAERDRLTKKLTKDRARLKMLERPGTKA